MDFRIRAYHALAGVLFVFCAICAVRGCVYKPMMDRLILPDSRVWPLPSSETEEGFTSEPEAMVLLPEIEETNAKPDMGE